MQRETEHVAEPFRWAIEVMNPARTDRLLEIGGGAGVAASLICPRLTSGYLLGIDRSKPMTAQATRRNAEWVRRGRASFEAVALEDAELDAARFDIAFAINVRVFRTNPGREGDVLRRALKPNGRLYLFQQHPSKARTHAVTEALREALTAHGFTVGEVLSRGSGASTMTCIIAGRRGARSGR